MKLKLKLLHLLFALLTIFAVHAQELYVCTYNVRYKNTSDTNAGNGWNTRRTYLINLVNFQQPDLLGVQEAMNSQMNDLASGLTGYGQIGVGRNDGSTGGEYSAIFYRKERMVLLDNGDFWLSDTPYKPSNGFPSKGGSTTYKRICTWGKFFDRAMGTVIYHFNTHMDLDETNRQQSFYLIKQKIQEIVGSTAAPVIISGDYNAVQTGEAYKLFYNSGFLYDCFHRTKQSFMTNGTCPGFDAGSYSTVSGELRRIDHIFVTKAFTVEHYGVLNPCYYSTDGTAEYYERAYSDHSPVFAKLTIRNPEMAELNVTPPPVVNGVYQLSTPEELQAFSFIVNGIAGYTQNAAAKAVMLNDIDMRGMSTWLPIGSVNTPFRGTFDGQGHAIHNIAIRTGKSYSGLFGNTLNATIKNFHLDGTLTVSEGYTEHGTVGYASSTTISDVHSELNITTSKANSDTRHIGGIAGSLYDNSTVTRCSFSGKITDAGTDTAGGIVGYADGSNNSISYCINYGTVKSNGATTNTGGILGYVNHEGFRISHCANVGTVSGNTDYAGQIVGRQMKAMTTLPSDLYYLEGGSLTAFGAGTEATSATGATAVSTDVVTSGKLTFLLNDGQSEGDLAFFQNLNEGEQTDPYPVLYQGHKPVFQGMFGKQQTPEDATEYNFYVNDGGRLADLGLINYFSTPVAFFADHASYSKETTDAWGTVYLPFTVTSTDDLQFYEVVPELTEGSVLAIAPCEMLGAYTPGLYQLTAGNFSVEASNVQVALPPTDTSIAAGNFLLTGTLDKLTNTEGYVFNEGSLQYTSGNIVTNPFEVWLTANGEQPQEVTLHIVDATGIVSPLSKTEEGSSIYKIVNLAGQRLTKAQRGINIINGKKYIIK